MTQNETVTVVKSSTGMTHYPVFGRDGQVIGTVCAPARLPKRFALEQRPADTYVSPCLRCEKNDHRRF
jgi:hypothetical protein